MELRQEYEDAVDHLRRQLDEATNDAGYWRSAYEDLLRDFHRICDERADLEARVDELGDRVDELECYIERDKDGDGFISKDAMDLLFPDTTEGES